MEMTIVLKCRDVEFKSSIHDVKVRILLNNIAAELKEKRKGKEAHIMAKSKKHTSP